jgi:hypothetical protein
MAVFRHRALNENQVTPSSGPKQGQNEDVAFIKDPDGY